MSKGFHTVDLHACASAAIPTPAIGQNGNWYVGNDDTGVKAGTTSNLDQRLADLEAKYEQVNSDIGKYSDDEIKIGTWIDGKPIYRKVINCGGVVNGKSVPHGITNVDRLLYPKCFALDDSSGDNLYPIPYITVGSSRFTSCIYDKNKISINTNDSWGNYTLYAIMEYTKTTD